MKTLTYLRLKELFDYDPETGIFKWRISKATTVKAGQIAGYKDNGYICIQIDGRKYKAHRLAWLFVHGYFPENDLDHINRKRDDNRLVNLREVSRQCYIRNSGNFCSNTSGVKGVYFDERKQRWRAQINLNGKPYHLGYYDDFDDAACARLATEQCVGWAGCDSSSPAYKHVQRMLEGILTKIG